MHGSLFSPGLTFVFLSPTDDYHWPLLAVEDDENVMLGSFRGIWKELGYAHFHTIGQLSTSFRKSVNLHLQVLYSSFTQLSTHT